MKNHANRSFPGYCPGLMFLFVLTLVAGSCRKAGIVKAPLSASEKSSFDRAHPDSVFSREFGDILTLNGDWEIAEGNMNEMPGVFSSVVPVPGLVTSAVPSFMNTGAENGPRQAFWYRKRFVMPSKVHEVVRLKIYRVMYGAKIYLNGKEVGSNNMSFVPQYYTISPYLRGNGQEETLVVRVGAHISVLPDTVVAGGDPERRLYPPGIYDRVELIMSSDPYISGVQVVPDPEKEIAGIAVDLKTCLASNVSKKLTAVVYDYETGEEVARISFIASATAPDTVKKITVSIPLPGCDLWMPGHPDLYVLKITDGEYNYHTRFGMRSFSVDRNFTNRALLNGKPCFIRGSNIALSRFFEDTLCGQLPWSREWVRTLIRRFTGMDMNGARFAFSQPPEMWYDIADEEGLIVFDEYPIWYAYQPNVGDVTEQANHPNRKWGIWPPGITSDRLTREYRAWMTERWNHPCVCVWDAQNETWARQTGEAIRRVRGLDLSGRPWDNGWSPPVDPGDIREAHPYFEGFIEGTEMDVARHNKPRPFTLEDIPSKEKVPLTFYLPYQFAYKLPAPVWYWQQPCIINEYSYMWLKRNGEPTTLTKKYYDTMLGEDATPDERRQLYARYLAAVTEYWRAARSCFGILYPFGLAGSLSECETSDNFIDIPNLLFDDHFNRYVPDAFASLAICPELWQKRFIIQPWRGTQAEFPVSVINDTDSSFRSFFAIHVVNGTDTLSTVKYRYEVEPFGLSRTQVKLDLPDKPGNYLVVSELHGRGNRVVRSYRDIEMILKP